MNTTNNPKNQYYQFLTIIICLFAYLLICLFPTQALGDTLSNGNYSIQVGNINTNLQPTPIPKPQTQVLGISAPQPEFTTGPNYTLNTSNDSFLIDTSQNTVDYGILSSTNPVIRTSSISFSDPKFGA